MSSPHDSTPVDGTNFARHSCGRPFASSQTCTAGPANLQKASRYPSFSADCDSLSTSRLSASRPQSPNWRYSSRASVPHYDWWAAGDVVEGSLCGQCPSAVACPHFWKRLLSLQRHKRSPRGGTYLHPWAILQARIFLASARYEMAFPDDGLQVNFWGLSKPCRSIIGVCVSPQVNFWGLSHPCRGNLGSV